MNQTTGGPASEKTLLDEFAGQALAGLYGAANEQSYKLAREGYPAMKREDVAKDCYSMASAMLAEKARREREPDSGIRTAQSDDEATVEYVIADSSTGTRMANLEAMKRELVWALDIVLFGWVDAYDDAEEVVKARAILAKAKEVA